MYVVLHAGLIGQKIRLKDILKRMRATDLQKKRRDFIGLFMFCVHFTGFHGDFIRVVLGMMMDFSSCRLTET